MEKSILEEIARNVEKSKKESRIAKLKTVGWSTVPVMTLGAIAGISSLVGYNLEDHDTRFLVTNGIAALLGGLIGCSGMVGDYIEKYKDLMDEIGYTSKTFRHYKNQIKSLNSAAL